MFVMLLNMSLLILKNMCKVLGLRIHFYLCFLSHVYLVREISLKGGKEARNIQTIEEVLCELLSSCYEFSLGIYKNFCLYYPLKNNLICIYIKMYFEYSSNVDQLLLNLLVNYWKYFQFLVELLIIKNFFTCALWKLIYTQPVYNKQIKGQIKAF